MKILNIEGRHLLVTGALAIACAASVAMQSMLSEAEAARILREKHMYLVHFMNDRYQVRFPPETEAVVYSGPPSEYVYSVPAPNGTSLFAVKRSLYLGGPDAPMDSLVRRPLEGNGGPEEDIST